VRWLAKAGAFKVLSVLPGGAALYHLAQDRVLGTTRVRRDAVLHHLRLGARYLEALDGADRSALHHLDLGAGWLPTIPFILYSSGVERHTLFDISRHMSLPPVRTLAAAFQTLPDSEPELTSRWSRRPPAPGPGATLEGYLQELGMHYRAPYRLEDVRAAQADVITCTGVLSHVPEQAIPELLSAVVAGMRPAGLFMAYVPLHDVFARIDRSITPFNKWRYSPTQWERIANSKLMQHNQLTAADYRRLFEAAGLETVAFETEEASPEEVEALERVKLHPDFAGRPREDFLPRSFVVVARK